MCGVWKKVMLLKVYERAGRVYGLRGPEGEKSSTQGTILWESSCGEERGGVLSPVQMGAVSWGGFHLICSQDPSAKCPNSSPLAESHFEGRSSATWSCAPEGTSQRGQAQEAQTAALLLHKWHEDVFPKVCPYLLFSPGSPFLLPFPWNSYWYWAAGSWSK